MKLLVIVILSRPHMFDWLVNLFKRRLQALMADLGIQPTEVTFAILLRIFTAARLDSRVRELEELQHTLALLQGHA